MPLVDATSLTVLPASPFLFLNPFRISCCLGFAANNKMSGTRGDSTPHLNGGVTTKIQGWVYTKSVGMRRHDMTERDLNDRRCKPTPSIAGFKVNSSVKQERKCCGCKIEVDEGDHVDCMDAEVVYRGPVDDGIMLHMQWLNSSNVFFLSGRVQKNIVSRNSLILTLGSSTTPPLDLRIAADQLHDQQCTVLHPAPVGSKVAMFSLGPHHVFLAGTKESIFGLILS
ncbi:hypothetical protein DFJ58DRAFT_846502 [Suillus subalutaceus]|uniref:uncharacterized protein n=1 Tax=Suillus subalutaceus TaxID=48586 RepID=UPI001B880458|nr:uncharacterized protein DFJ58DRAFT_846502 [Suillus subalutaceus]KAG1837360.1 hypothetical protein DFJ58DRAFT_846502 [Suillus subalutaceus]